MLTRQFAHGFPHVLWDVHCNFVRFLYFAHDGITPLFIHYSKGVGRTWPLQATRLLPPKGRGPEPEVLVGLNRTVRHRVFHTTAAPWKTGRRYSMRLHQFRLGHCNLASSQACGPQCLSEPFRDVPGQSGTITVRLGCCILAMLVSRLFEFYLLHSYSGFKAERRRYGRYVGGVRQERSRTNGRDADIRQPQ